MPRDRGMTLHDHVQVVLLYSSTVPYHRIASAISSAVVIRLRQVTSTYSSTYKCFAFIKFKEKSERHLTS